MLMKLLQRRLPGWSAGASARDHNGGVDVPALDQRPQLRQVANAAAHHDVLVGVRRSCGAAVLSEGLEVGQCRIILWQSAQRNDQPRLRMLREKGVELLRGIAGAGQSR